MFWWQQKSSVHLILFINLRSLTFILVITQCISWLPRAENSFGTKIFVTTETLYHSDCLLLIFEGSLSSNKILISTEISWYFNHVSEELIKALRLLIGAVAWNLWASSTGWDWNWNNLQKKKKTTGLPSNDYKIIHPILNWHCSLLNTELGINSHHYRNMF